MVHKGLADPSLLESYTTERLPVITEMLGRTTAIFNKTITFKTDSAEENPFVRPKILHQLGVNCRWSPILVDEQPEAEGASTEGAYLSENPAVLYAGDRAPDAPGLLPVGGVSAESTSLFKIFDPTCHTVLVFVADVGKAQPVLNALAAYPEGTVTAVVMLPNTAQNARAIKGAALTLVDHDGHARVAYPPTVKGFSTVVVRPDGVVGAVVQGVEGVTRYFNGLFARS